MQGADKVNDELEVGYDETFERRWSHAERSGYVVMLVLVAAGIAGLFGRGPFSHRTVSSPASGLAVDFEPVARSQCDTQVTFHIKNDTAATTIDLFLDNHLVEPMGLHQVLPQPVVSQTAPDGLRLSIAVPAYSHDTELRVMLMPDVIGPVHMVAHLQGHPVLRWTQFVVP
ncbi:hypothetical protein [Lichenicola sp.]|uniref:hypothetical protein n=1 Tax=Lichenicola sp. TaxID=2804529 RepID=UPI003AFFBD4F